MERIDSYTKGVGFEKFMAELFRKAGYIVEHNVVLTGRSGVKHQIDLLVTYKTPIMDFRVLVECKNWDKPVNKDVVMKVYNEVQDLGLDKGVIVTQSYATPDATIFAKSVGIEIIDGARLNELTKTLGIETTTEEAVGEIYYFPTDTECLQKIIKKETVQYKVYYYPLYMFKLKTTRTVKRGLFRIEKYVVEEEHLVFIDAVKGHSIKFTDKQILFKDQVPVKLSNEELAIYKYIVKAKMVNVDQVAGHFGISVTKARRILEGLVSKNLIEPTRIGKKKHYTLKSLLTLYGPIEENIQLQKHKSIEGIELRPRLSVAELIKIVEATTNSKIEDYKLVYYPITMIVQDNKKILVDTYICKQMKHIEEIIDIIK